jgi:hypothetical protein
MQPSTPNEHPENVLSEKESHELAMLTHVQRRFYESEQCAEVRDMLQEIIDDPACGTHESNYEGGDPEFIERHLRYLSQRPGINIEGYISNLRIMTKRMR